MATNLLTNGNESKILKTRMVTNLKTNANRDKYFYQFALIVSKKR